MKYVIRFRGVFFLFLLLFISLTFASGINDVVVYVNNVKSNGSKIQVITLRNGVIYEVPKKNKSIQRGDQVEVVESSRELNEQVKEKHPKAIPAESVKVLSRDTKLGSGAGTLM